MSKPTSLRAHTEGSLNGTFKSQRERILDLLMRQGPMTNRMIATVLKMETATVSARVNALLELGLLQQSGNERPCMITKKTVRYVEVIWPQDPEQLGLL
jgi:DNA-binding MarR family transcriptional regulator